MFGDHHEQRWLKILQRKIAILSGDDLFTASEIFIQLNCILRFYIPSIKFVDSLSHQRFTTDESIQVKKVRTSLKRLRSMSIPVTGLFESQASVLALILTTSISSKLMFCWERRTTIISLDSKIITLRSCPTCNKAWPWSMSTCISPTVRRRITWMPCWPSGRASK